MTWIFALLLTVVSLSMPASASEKSGSMPDVIWHVKSIRPVTELSIAEQSFVQQISQEQTSWVADVVAYEVAGEADDQVGRRIIVAPRNNAVHVGSRIRVEGEWTALRQSVDLGFEPPSSAVSLEAVERIEVFESR